MSLSFLFGKTVKPEEVVRKWQRELRKEERNIERSIRGSLSPSICSLCTKSIHLTQDVGHTSTDVWATHHVDLDREEQKVKLEIKQAAKRGDQKTARILAKQIVQSRRAKERMYKSKAELHSISLALTHQLGTSASSPLPPPRALQSTWRLTRSSVCCGYSDDEGVGRLGQERGGHAVDEQRDQASRHPADHDGHGARDGKGLVFPLCQTSTNRARSCLTTALVVVRTDGAH